MVFDSIYFNEGYRVSILLGSICCLSLVADLS